jgi:outer membrane protein OmpA-like peptidoglycan-associated protein/tetratricopeptide (TPR) repeat protein
MKNILHNITFLLVLQTTIALPVFGQSLKTADSYYSGGAYYGASVMYKDLLDGKHRNDKDIRDRRGEIMYRLAECYRRMNSIDESQKWYLQAEGAGYTEWQLYYGYGCTQLLQGNYAGARESFQKVRDINPGEKRVESKLLSCDSYELYGKVNNQYEIAAVSNLNTRGSEYGLAFFGDKLIFASTGLPSSKKAISERTGLPYSDIYMSSPDSRSLYGKVERLDAFKEDKGNEGTFSYDAHTNQLYCTRCESNSRNCYIAKVEIKNGRYKEVGKLKLGNQTYGIGHPYITEDGKRIYFTSVMEGGYGGSDLWYVDRDLGDVYGKPVNLGPNINTVGDEVFPSFIGGVLYFSSDGHAGLGGLDLFASYLEDDGSFGKPFNLRAPFNSSWDDFNLVHRPNSNLGLFISNRNNSTSSDDIYKFEHFPPKLMIFSGQVYDQQSNSIITDYTILVTDENGKKVFEQRVTGDRGYFVYMGEDKSYDIKVSSPSYLSATEKVSTQGIKNFAQLSGKTFLRKDEIEDKVDNLADINSGLSRQDSMDIGIGIKIVMRDILYEFDKFRLTESSKRELDTYIEYFYQYPNMAVEISSHTDSRGDYDYNQKLSDSRAKAVVEYFISRGISPSRLKWRGYGETQMIYPNARNEREHQANRRTEFKVLNLGINVEVRHVSAVEIVNNTGGSSDLGGWWLQVHESNNYRELELPAIRRAGQLTGKEVRLIRCADGKYRYCIQYGSKSAALRSQVLLYKENINTILIQF